MVSIAAMKNGNLHYIKSKSSPDPQYIDKWEEYWMEVAVTASRKSKDPRCRVGAVIVKENASVSMGFNGFARQVFDNPALLADPEEKLKLICHAEQNAIHNAARLGVALQGTTIYVTKFPCLACCNAIIQAGITGIYTHDSKFWDDDPADGDHSRKKSILRQAKIKVEAPFHPDFLPKQITGKPSTNAPASQEHAELSLPGLTETPPPKRTKAKRAVAPETMRLFPARRPIRGGKANM